ncbi:BolA/IbaG family iron-sulfur metabolism protein [Lyticum sinuosum]|uniref:BolA family transcriptional regulator n=1 Tax=Lyticum sinuosum TaxID=1332059 RepID=A0AAE4VKI3_9RICK|nr:BolA/IbaG family iron-sulfur metabolism protein [Lyticum sinuosum]MDZ5761033.1 BolA family transcriptional regulator [Lyticum sinuosum]
MSVITTEELIKILQDKFPNSDIDVEDIAGDNNHYSISIKSVDFKGLSLVDQHRLVYNRLGDLSNKIHALKIKTINY